MVGAVVEPPHRHPVDPPTADRSLVRGLAWSVACHGLAFVLAALLLPAVMLPPPADLQTVAVTLVRLEDVTASPQLGKAAVPAQPAASTRPQHTESPKARPSQTGIKPSPDSFDAKLRAIERQMEQSRQNQSGDGVQTAFTNRLGARAGYSIKDFVTAQIQQHWNFDAAKLASAGWVISVHVALSSTGVVEAVEILEDPRFHENPAYRALAKSVRDAVVITSPVRLPAGLPPAQRDMVLQFDPRLVLR